MFVTLGEMSLWDPMKEQYFSKRNAYSVDVNDPAVAMLGYGEYARVSVIRDSLFVHVWSKCYINGSYLN